VYTPAIMAASGPAFTVGGTLAIVAEVVAGVLAAPVASVTVSVTV